uniref:NK6 homeobox 3 n=1 Tax=Latimeria chalumnae TaxID=7897 RepID=H3AFT7_LATCH|nr:PREDICTED: homeobox protein Nkx-6.3 [Latimeria chalumnae]|eukprot:XP_006002898.1 PREDICTED: homeobox protein Nkx-6.3 [Latimeria chalumnae]
MEPHLQGAFLLNNPPLGQFSEIKSPICQYSVSNSFCKPNTPRLNSQLAAGTPHGICDILSRPVASPNNGLFSSYPYGGGFGGVSPPGIYYNPQVGGDFGKANNEFSGKARNSWGDAGQEWRGARQLCNIGSNPITEGAGRKKHTRPTFTGHQIFALEKTFEQTKYLAGPERARLAYSLGMTESQVKVWFQNRRTKWRKKNATEPSPSNERSTSGAGDHVASENEDDEYNKPLDPNSDDEKIRLLLRKHRAAFSVLSLGTANV